MLGRVEIFGGARGSSRRDRGIHARTSSRPDAGRRTPMAAGDLPGQRAMHLLDPADRAATGGGRQRPRCGQPRRQRCPGTITPRRYRPATARSIWRRSRWPATCSTTSTRASSGSVARNCAGDGRGGAAAPMGRRVGDRLPQGQPLRRAWRPGLGRPHPLAAEVISTRRCNGCAIPPNRSAAGARHQIGQTYTDAFMIEVLVDRGDLAGAQALLGCRTALLATGQRETHAAAYRAGQGAVPSRAARAGPGRPRPDCRTQPRASRTRPGGPGRPDRAAVLVGGRSARRGRGAARSRPRLSAAVGTSAGSGRTCCVFWEPCSATTGHRRIARSRGGAGTRPRPSSSWPRRRPRSASGSLAPARRPPGGGRGRDEVRLPARRRVRSRGTAGSGRENCCPGTVWRCRSSPREPP